MTATITTKFKKGQTLWMIQYKNIENTFETCPCCEGKAKIDVNGASFVCAKCNGDGHIETEFRKWVAEKVKIYEIDITMCEEEGTLQHKDKYLVERVTCIVADMPYIIFT